MTDDILNQAKPMSKINLVCYVICGLWFTFKVFFTVSHILMYLYCDSH